MGSVDRVDGRGRPARLGWFVSLLLSIALPLLSPAPLTPPPRTVLLPFFADVAKNGPESLPADQRPGPSWFPTLTLSLDFKAKFPLPPASAKRTFGLYSTTKSIHDGRHDLTVEVWSAPLDLGEGGTAEDGGKWRTEGSRLLGVSTQVRFVLLLFFPRRRF